MSGTVRIESRPDGVRILSLDRPPVNALGRELVEDALRNVGCLGWQRHLATGHLFDDLLEHRAQIDD